MSEKILTVLRQVQEVVGRETSVEVQRPRFTPDVYHTRLSAGERLRIDAQQADKRDAAIIALRSLIDELGAQKNPAPIDSAVKP
jgi:hypothetical protein